MKVGDVYYEKHTVVGISKRTNTVSETDVERVNVLPIDVLDKIRTEIKEHADRLKDSLYGDGMRHCIDIIDKYRESEDKE